MASITHLEAHRLLQLAADAALEPGDRLALKPHLTECAECKAYARGLEATQDILRRSMHRRWDPQKAGLSIDKIQKHSRRTSMFNKWSVTFGTLGVIAALVVAFAILVNGQPRAQIIPPADAPTLTQIIPPAATREEGKTPTPSAKPLVLSGELSGYLRDARWSPDGKQIAFIYDAADDANPGGSRLEIVNTDGSGLQKLADSAAVILNWSEDGSRLLFCSGQYDGDVAKSELFSISTDGTGLSNITNQKITQALQGSCGIVSSPDGKRLAFTRQVFNGGLFVMELNGENLRELTPPNTGISDFTWSPDGSQIVFLGQDSFNPSFTSGLYQVRSDGGTLTPDWTVIPMNARDARSKPAFSPDGQKIVYFVDNEIKVDINVMSSHGELLGTLAHLSSEITQLEWSPDGAQIAFSAGYQEEKDIVVMKADGSDLRHYYNPGWNDLNPRWSPDGQQLVFVSSRDYGQDGQLILISVQDLQPYPAP